MKDTDFTWLMEFGADEIEDRRTRANTFFVEKSGFSFLDEHYGPRPGCLHALLGASGRGKSSLVLSLILRWCRSTTALLYLSEEDRNKVELQLANMEPSPKYLSTKLHVVEEPDLLQDLEPSHLRAFFQVMEAKLKASGAKILIIDNATTSRFYSHSFRASEDFIAGLKILAIKLEIAVFVVCHPKKGVSETSKGILTFDDVRGNAQLGLMADYFYALHRYHHTSPTGSSVFVSFIYVAKSRHHANQDCVYRLDFNVNTRRYEKDTPANFETFQKAAKDRVRT